MNDIPAMQQNILMVHQKEQTSQSGKQAGAANQNNFNRNGKFHDTDDRNPQGNRPG
jgi:hypothetical protein